MRGGVIAGAIIIGYALAMFGVAYILHRIYLATNPASRYDFTIKTNVAFSYNFPMLFKHYVPTLNVIVYLCFLAICFCFLGAGIAIFSLIYSDELYSIGPSPVDIDVPDAKCVVTNGAIAVAAMPAQTYVMNVPKNSRACAIDEQQMQRDLATSARPGHAPPYSQFSIVTKPAHGSVGFTTSPDVRVLYRPAEGYRGMDFFEYRLLPDGRLRTVIVSVE